MIRNKFESTRNLKVFNFEHHISLVRFGIMGDKYDIKNHPLTPKVTESVTNTNTCDTVTSRSSFLYKDSTLQRGSVLGVMRPIWHKTTESEERLKWLNKMIGKRLFVREIEAFLKATSSKFRSEESIIREEERKVLMDIMILKRNDERRHLRKQKKEKENLRRYIQEQYGKRKCYNLIVKYLRKKK